MNAASHFISILLSIGSFLGLPYIPLSTHLPSPAITLPGLERPASTSIFSSLGGPASTTFQTYAPLLPTAYSTSSPENILKKPTPTKKQKLPTLAIQVPTFTPIPLSSNGPSSSTAPQAPAIPTLPTATPTSTSTSTNPNPPTTSNPIASVVNIYCTTQVGNNITIVTGSGVVIDNRGVILTNAHVADQILLADYLDNPNKNCFIRKGSPAVSFYKATVLYISPAWLRAHGSEVNQSNQSEETGEGDYALLLVNGAVNGDTLPRNFSSIPVDTTDTSLGDNTPILAVGYPAGALSSNEVIRNLRIETDNLSIVTNYTFASGGGADLIRTTGTPIAERGASGGGIVNTDGKLIGLIATTIPDLHSNLKDLQALTLSYINRDLQRSAGLSLSAFLNRNLSTVAANFKAHDEQELVSYLPH